MPRGSVAVLRRPVVEVVAGGGDPAEGPVIADGDGVATGAEGVDDVGGEAAFDH
jgi:hypothetical protein